MSEISMYNTMTYNDIYPDKDKFIEDYKSCGIPTIIQDKSAETLHYLLVARYGNNPIANSDINQFKIKIFATVFQFGPTWEKRLDIQDKLRNLNEEELMTGATNIYNTALNDGGQPSDQSKKELPFINNQNVNKYTKSKVEAYAALMDLLRTDVTEDFLRKFKNLFKVFVADERPLLYTDGDCED